jgi:hypothetical protein
MVRWTVVQRNDWSWQKKVYPPPHFTEVPVTSQKCTIMYVCEYIEVFCLFLHFPDLDFRTVLTANFYLVNSCTKKWLKLTKLHRVTTEANMALNHGPWTKDTDYCLLNKVTPNYDWSWYGIDWFVFNATSLSPIWHGFAPSFVNYIKGALYSQPQVKFSSCLPMVGGSLRVLWLLPPLKLVAMI